MKNKIETKKVMDAFRCNEKMAELMIRTAILNDDYNGFVSMVNDRLDSIVSKR